MLSGARGFQILARRLGVELSQAQFNDIKDIDTKEIDFSALKNLSKTHNLVCRYLNTKVHYVNQSIKEPDRMSYIAPIDETKFWLYEILEVQRMY